jgi:lysine-specific demethylase 3
MLLHLLCSQDFLEMLPVPSYTNPQLGLAPLNLASALLPRDNPTDLGPKTYIAYGRLEEGRQGKEGDSVTKLHLDMTDAVNICLHAQYGPGEEVAVRCGDQEAVQPR